MDTSLKRIILDLFALASLVGVREIENFGDVNVI